MNLIKHQQQDDDKSYLYVEDPIESKYHLLISERGKISSNYEKNSKTFIDYSPKNNDVYENRRL